MINFTKTVLLLAFVSFLSASYAQNAAGGKVGINLATWNGDDEFLGDDIGSILGIQIGGAFEIGINDMISVQPELLFIQKGVKSEFTEEFFGEVIEVKGKNVLNYLDVPILVKVKFGDPESTNFFLTVGPQFGYALGGKSKVETTINGETETEEEDIDFDEDDGFARFEISGSFGAGVNIPAGPGNLFIEARYLLGLSNLNDSDDDFSIKNGGIGIGVGFMAPIGE